jgi:5-methyltetrahydropteroyltriglutamate--homocysteine methyltransferase
VADALFPTTVIGSLPRPAWVRDLILDRKAGRLVEPDADRLLDRAIDSALALQERAGLDEVTDGEWRRESYVKVFAERVRGFRPDLNPSGGLPYPAVVAPVEYDRPIAADEVRYLRSRTRRRVKVTLPSPYIIGRRMYPGDRRLRRRSSAAGHDAEPSAAADAVRFEVGVVDRENRGQGLPVSKVDERGIGKVHRVVRVAPHEVLQSRQVRIVDGQHGDGPRSEEAPRGVDFPGSVADEVEQLRQDGRRGR